MHPTTVSPDGIELVKRFEGLHKVQDDGMVAAYRCPAGKWTIGFGSTKGIRSGDEDDAECEQRLIHDLKDAEAEVKRSVTVPLTQGQYDARVFRI